MKVLITSQYKYIWPLIYVVNFFNNLTEDISTILKNILNKNSPRKNLIIFDDIFPHLLSAFRIAEYNYYLSKFENSEIHSTAAAFPLINEKRSFADVVVAYESHYPQFKNMVLKFNRFNKLNCELIYLIFLNNAFNFVDYIDELEIPFVFTLYPGGGFKLDQEDSDRKLRRVISSPNFRKIIVTQKISYEYLIENKFCTLDQVEFIYGVVLPSGKLHELLIPKKYYKKDKDTFDICFVAHKYMEKGIDKGFDVFIEVAKKLHKQYGNILFHVIGPYDGSDIDVTELNDSIVFYGTKNTNFFSDFYSRMDIILSPNIPFVLAPGAFDGFPTGSCVEAGLCGVAVFCTDVLKLNVSFKDREEIVIIPVKVQEIVDIVFEYYEDPNKLYQLSNNCRVAFQRKFDIEHQMIPRLKVLSQYLRENNH